MSSVAFVTGATGLLGSSLVRALVREGYTVRALARCADKARLQLGGLSGVEVVVGDVTDVPSFAPALEGVDVLFHTAAYFRESFHGGSHWDRLRRVNVEGTRALLDCAYARGVRRVVHTSSIAVLDGPRGATIDETMVRKEPVADDYYRSKVEADRVVDAALARHPDLHACFVLPGWMHGPGDAGPTAAGQLTLDFLAQKLPGIPPSTFAFVDARDVAEAHVAAADRGRRGERYLAAGRHLDAAELLGHYERITGIPAPRWRLPWVLLLLLALVQELYARVTSRPVLLSLATVLNMKAEAERTRFDHHKSERELGLRFRPIRDTLRDEVAWFSAQAPSAPESTARPEHA